MESLELPSEINDRDYIFMPLNTNVMDDDDEWLKYGKWMWSSQRDSARHDQVWKDLQPLLSDGTLIRIKASTAKMKERPGVISCYTKIEKEDIKRAAEAMRSIIKHNTIMYYKINNLIESNTSNLNENKKSVKYMYTVKYHFYEKDHLGRWKLTDEERSPIHQLGGHVSKSCFTQILSNSVSDERDLKLPTYFEKEGSTGWWNILCDNLERDEYGWTEADRVWAAATSLYEKHTFARISYCRKEQRAYVACYVTSYSDIESLTQSVKKLMETSWYMNLVFFYVYDASPERKFIVKYKFTAEGELYKVTPENGFESEQFILQLDIDA